MAATNLKQPRARRERDPEQTRAEILQAAADEFAERRHGDLVLGYLVSS